MWNLLDKILNDFKICFSRKASFNWFVIIIIGFMLRSDSLGVTSVIRDLNIAHSSYATMIHFFHENWQFKKYSLRIYTDGKTRTIVSKIFHLLSKDVFPIMSWKKMKFKFSLKNFL